MEQTVSIILKELGVRPSLQGYAMLRDAIIMTLNKDKNTKLFITKDIYPKIASMYASSPARVERAMRHAVETAFDGSFYSDTQHEIFGNTVSKTRGCPTVGDFIATVADYILVKYKFRNIADVM